MLLLAQAIEPFASDANNSDNCFASLCCLKMAIGAIFFDADVRLAIAL